MTAAAIAEAEPRSDESEARDADSEDDGDSFTELLNDEKDEGDSFVLLASARSRASVEVENGGMVKEVSQGK
ncbi:hypothetical protein Poly51_29200 [Rubripirellula tenax]|uniref:Uncharacterized protein n=1 Tax=Rubripirellula tenax TaxID=2528015 RepID=A0A5C6FBM2_9BACT|nr:hypothetical protein Poly51_29200 [Rubripirellula tenax]